MANAFNELIVSEAPDTMTPEVSLTVFKKTFKEFAYPFTKLTACDGNRRTTQKFSMNQLVLG